MTRVGFALGYGKFSNVRETAKLMREAEEHGFEMSFFGDHRDHAGLGVSPDRNWSRRA